MYIRSSNRQPRTQTNCLGHLSFTWMNAAFMALALSAMIICSSSVAWAGIYRQAPMLEAKVAEGSLPDVDARLPSNPMLVQPVEEIGRYGGNWRMAMRRGRDHALLIRTIGYENLVRWNPEWTQVIPNLAQSFNVNDKATEYTFSLRRGLRWSDGEPFTADDIMFWYEDVLQNETLSTDMNAWRIFGGKYFAVQKVDDFTVRFVFQEPHGLFLDNMAAPEGAEPTSYPAHYLKKYHIKYNPDADSEAKAAGFADWREQFFAKFGKPGTIDDRSRWLNSELPVLYAWTLDGEYTKDEPLVAVRNPYYWKVDTAGQQLPYIDQITYEVVESKKDARQVAREGRIDMQVRHIGNFAAEVVQDGSKWPQIRTFEAIDTDMNSAVISLNLNHKDPVLRGLFQDKAFRVALSVAINRSAIIRRVLDNRGEPYQAGPRPESALYNEKLAKQFTEYDVDNARALLDRLGLEKGADGIRRRPDGKPLSFFIDAVGDARAAIVEEIARYWQAVGIDVTPRHLDRNAFYDNREVNEHDASIWGGDGGIAVMQSPIYYFPFTYESLFAVKWARWFQDPNDSRGEKPPAKVLRQMTLYRQLVAQGEPDVRSQLMSEILDIAAEEFLVFGISLPPVRYGIYQQNVGNVPAVMPAAWSYPTPAPTNPAQYFFR
ncbi:ABC transporter substrate-binding protein [Aestuariispira insulae]|uniref:Peptide/nickel transport system substrate-binding protein n=1 Tax=Aestuariispira insulae TaxID=1461337 RepID=A0A3D9HWN1_9PROT|nr:ABC transporter substrate-binding protein [Aestuariispira insulae]RED53913.1 peptide/nickel transport system substrate-binding protein [Aestuariispira insulae]